jgi:SAM-dependent methyltransferase
MYQAPSTCAIRSTREPGRTPRRAHVPAGHRSARAWRTSSRDCPLPGQDARQAEFVEGDFKSARWPLALSGPYDAVLAMQSVHEVRHKRHVAALYAQVRSLLRPGGPLLVADHTPLDDSPRWTALHSTAEEQLAALARAGFATAEVLLVIDRLLLLRAR